MRRAASSSYARWPRHAAAPLIVLASRCSAFQCHYRGGVVVPPILAGQSSWASYTDRALCGTAAATVARRWRHRDATADAKPWASARKRTPWGLGPTCAGASSSLTARWSACVEVDEDAAESRICSPSRWDAVEDGRRISTLLVCGDGDLSFSATVAPDLAELGIRLTATVLEDREVHHATYRNSRDHTETILSSNSPTWTSGGEEEDEVKEGGGASGHEVVFGVNATDLPSSFSGRTFDRIVFNFPHWRGKANHRYNRALLSDFLRSAAGALTPGGVGEVHVALCEGQGGATAPSREAWRASWKAAEYANEHGLLLMDVFPYRAEYDLSSHRGMDRGFSVGKVPKMYVFKKPGIATAKEFQLCCRHELHVNLPEDMDGNSMYSLKDIVDGDAVQKIIESVVPDGVRVEVPMRKCLSPEETGSSCRVGVYLVVYAGEQKPLTRAEADEYRSLVEREVANHIPLRANRANRTVSRLFPYPLLSKLIAHYLSRG
mmetsp:Transcript_6952/g.20856  ORF Transcript_6952/g.20856 Transcript_6952/m.20856 type:complete len:492 (-) Transcript_6952:613-2088(-)